MQTLVVVAVPLEEEEEVLGLVHGGECSMVEAGWAGHTWMMDGARARALCSRSSGSRLDVEGPRC